MPQQTEYKKPRRINAVSLSLLMFTASLVYVLYAMWPVLRIRSAVKSEMEDVLPKIYQMNLRPESIGRPEIVKLRKALVDRLRQIGVRDKDLQVLVQRDKKRVALEARFATTTEFPVWGKKMRFQLTPRAETDAARVEW